MTDSGLPERKTKEKNYRNRPVWRASVVGTNPSEVHVELYHWKWVTEVDQEFDSVRLPTGTRWWWFSDSQRHSDLVVSNGWNRLCRWSSRGNVLRHVVEILFGCCWSTRSRWRKRIPAARIGWWKFINGCFLRHSSTRKRRVSQRFLQTHRKSTEKEIVTSTYGWKIRPSRFEQWFVIFLEKQTGEHWHFPSCERNVYQWGCSLTTKIQSLSWWSSSWGSCWWRSRC